MQRVICNMQITKPVLCGTGKGILYKHNGPPFVDGYVFPLAEFVFGLALVINGGRGGITYVDCQTGVALPVHFSGHVSG